MDSALDMLQDLVKPPELTADEWAVVAKAKPFLRSVIVPEVTLELEEKYSLREIEFREALDKDMRAAVEASMAQWRKDQEPLSTEDIAKLLSQDYIHFDFTVRMRKGSETKHFIISELSQDAELRFIEIAQRTLIPLMQTIASAEFTVDGSFIEQLQAILRKCPEALSVARDLVAVCLDPWEEDKDINPEWVKKNLSTSRIEHVLTAQCEANRYRDFFSKGSQLYRSLMKK